MSGVLSDRARHALDFPNPKMEMLNAVGGNWYEEKSNSQGVIDLGTAENMLCEDIMLDRLRQPDMTAVESSHLYYGPVYEDVSMRNCMADFLNKKMKAAYKFKQENIVMVVGAGGAYDLLFHNLADPGESFLTPAPYYYWLKSDIGYRSQVDCISVPIDETDPNTGHTEFVLSVDKLDKALTEAIKKGSKVRGVAINNPQNPTGQVYPTDLIHDILVWAKSKDLHVVMNEIYGLTTFDGDFKSMTTLPTLPDPERTHFIWGFSKDFTLSGFRVGMIHSWNSALTQTLQAMRLFCAVPGVIQTKLQILLNDTDWLEKKFFPTNHKRLRDGRDCMMKWLDKYGVPHTIPKSTFYVWADFSKYVHEGETEMDLFRRFISVGVYAEPGHIFHGRKRGFFRILYSLPRTVLELGLTRMSMILDKNA